MTTRKQAVRRETVIPRFKQGVGVASWKLAAALLAALLLGVGGGVAKSNLNTQKQALSDYELGLEVQSDTVPGEG